MNNAASVALALFFGIFLVVVVGSAGLLIFLSYKLRISVEKFQADQIEWIENIKSLLDFSEEESMASFEKFSKEVTAQINSLKGVVTTYKSETKTTLDTHRSDMQSKIDSINSVGMQTAAAAIIKASRELQQTASTVHQLLTQNEEKEQSPSNLGAEEYAPDNSTIYGQTSPAIQDALFEKQETIYTHES